MIAGKTLVLYLATVISLVCTPGPDMLFVLSQGLVAQRRGAVLGTLGICSGYLVHALLATLGLAALIAASPLLFDIIRWVGAAYLLYLGVRRILSANAGLGEQLQSERISGLLRRGMLTSLLNPKGTLFFLALLPQFVDRASGQVALQTLILALIFVGACLVIYLAIGLMVAKLRGRFKGRTAGRAANGVAGTVCTALGLRLALLR